MLYCFWSLFSCAFFFHCYWVTDVIIHFHNNMLQAWCQFYSTPRWYNDAPGLTMRYFGSLVVFLWSDYMVPFNLSNCFLIFVASLQDDVLENNFNVLRMFVKIYGPSTAPTMLVSMTLTRFFERNSVGFKIWILSGEIIALFTWNIVVKWDDKHIDWSVNFILLIS